MCLIAFALGLNDQWPLVIAANRDEFHHRPTLAADWWADTPALYGGRDLSAGGTWLALSTSGRLGALTNYKEPVPALANGVRSRGEVIRQYLCSDASAEQWAGEHVSVLEQYAGFNALLFDWHADTTQPEAWYLSNRHPSTPVTRLRPGIYGLSNHLLGTRWPKVQRLQAALSSALERAASIESDLFDALADSRPIGVAERATGHAGASDEVLARTPFIADQRYGTRASTVVMVGRRGDVRFSERSWDWHEGAPRLTGERTMTIPPSD